MKSEEEQEEEKLKCELSDEYFRLRDQMISLQSQHAALMQRMNALNVEKDRMTKELCGLGQVTGRLDKEMDRVLGTIQIKTTSVQT